MRPHPNSLASGAQERLAPRDVGGSGRSNAEDGRHKDGRLSAAGGRLEDDCHMDGRLVVVLADHRMGGRLSAADGHLEGEVDDRRKAGRLSAADDRLVGDFRKDGHLVVVLDGLHRDGHRSAVDDFRKDDRLGDVEADRRTGDHLSVVGDHPVVVHQLDAHPESEEPT